MTEEVAKETLTIDGVPHVVEDLTQDQQYMVRQIKDLQQKSNTTRFVLDQCTVASKAFTQGLINSLNAPAEDAKDAAPVDGAAASKAFDAEKVKDTF